LSVTPYIFIVGIASLIAWLLEVSLAAFDHQQYWLLILFVAFLAVCVFLSMRVNLNEFSMNLFYRNRLVRAYLGASHASRMPNPFTGFDPHDTRARSRS
jgi:hypothetical protein